MDRFNSELFLTTTQVAQLLSVHPSTVKRWCNDEELTFDKTEGGHRRIHLNDVLELARERQITSFLQPFSPYEAHVWTAVNAAVGDGDFSRVHALAMGWLHLGHLRRIGALFFELGRHPELSFAQFCDRGLAGFMVQIGETWRSGRLRVGEEHMVTEALVETLFRLRVELAPDETTRPGDGRSPPTAIVGSMEGDRHHIGALCGRLLLEQAGWDVYYLGADVPVEDFAAIQRSRAADLVCVSFAPPNTAADMKRCIRILGEFYDPEHPFTLVLGGHVSEAPFLGDLDVPFSSLAFFSSMSEFSQGLQTGLRPPSRAAESDSEGEGAA